jgi:hypothetical protein
MNRYRKEQIQKRAEARKGLTEEETAELDKEEAAEEKILQLTRKLHLEMFPEEYDFMLDDVADANRRQRGENPMNTDYIEKVQRRREEHGVSPLGNDGKAVSDDSFLLCRKLIEERLRKDEEKDGE